MEDIDFRELWKLTDSKGKPLKEINTQLINSRIELAEVVIRDIERQIVFLKAAQVRNNEPFF